MIQISNLSKKYGETVVFSDLNYTFEKCLYLWYIVGQIMELERLTLLNYTFELMDKKLYRSNLYRQKKDE